MAGHSIRQATEADAARIAPSFDRYRQFYGQQPDVDRAAAFLTDRLRNGESFVFLVEEGDEVVGFAQLYPTFSSVRADRALVLNDLFVEDHARGRGIAQDLLDRVEQFARDEGYARMTLATGVDNRTAQALYRSRDWVRDDNFVNFTRKLRP